MKRQEGQEEQQVVKTAVPVELVDIVNEKEKDESRGAGQGASEQATSNTGVAGQHQPKLRGEAIAGTRHIRLRQRLPGHPGRNSLPRGVANRGDHRVGHHWRLLPNDRSPAPGAHPSRDGNLRRALTTPHLHLPSRRRRV